NEGGPESPNPVLTVISQAELIDGDQSTKLGEAKTLGGVGSILQLIPFLDIVGYVLTLVAVKRISEELQDRTIFDNMLYAVLSGIVGVVVGLAALVSGILSSLFTFGITAILG